MITDELEIFSPHLLALLGLSPMECMLQKESLPKVKSPKMNTFNSIPHRVLSLVSVAFISSFD